MCADSLYHPVHCVSVCDCVYHGPDRVCAVRWQTPTRPHKQVVSCECDRVSERGRRAHAPRLALSQSTVESSSVSDSGLSRSIALASGDPGLPFAGTAPERLSLSGPTAARSRLSLGDSDEHETDASQLTHARDREWDVGVGREERHLVNN